jgi:hypothetical protein
MIEAIEARRSTSAGDEFREESDDSLMEALSRSIMRAIHRESQQHSLDNQEALTFFPNRCILSI